MSCMHNLQMVALIDKSDGIINLSLSAYDKALNPLIADSVFREDVVTIVYDFPQEKHELVPQDIALNITYEDDDILIVNKQAGMVVHPGFGNYDGTLVNALAFHFQNLPNIGKEDRPGLVHRIDKNTSGILVIAKTEKSMVV